MGYYWLSFIAQTAVLDHNFGYEKASLLKKLNITLTSSSSPSNNMKHSASCTQHLSRRKLKRKETSSKWASGIYIQKPGNKEKLGSSQTLQICWGIIMPQKAKRSSGAISYIKKNGHEEPIIAFSMLILRQISKIMDV